MRSKPNWLWIFPLVFIAVLFYWPLSKIIGLGLSANWIEIYLESATLKAIWFTVWQAAVSTLIALVIGIPGAYILYRKKFLGQTIYSRADYRSAGITDHRRCNRVFRFQ